MLLPELFAQVLKVPLSAINDSTSPKTEPHWDSLRHIEVVMALEQHYGVRFSTAEVLAIDSLASARTLLTKKGVTSS